MDLIFEMRWMRGKGKEVFGVIDCKERKMRIWVGVRLELGICIRLALDYNLGWHKISFRLQPII